MGQGMHRITAQRSSNINDFGPIGSPSQQSKFGSQLGINGNVESDQRTRSFLIENVSKNLSSVLLAGFFNVRHPFHPTSFP
jgi:hypothetical protein